MPTKHANAALSKYVVYLDFLAKWNKLDSDDKMLLQGYLNRLKLQWEAAAAIERESRKSDGQDPLLDRATIYYPNSQ